MNTKATKDLLVMTDLNGTLLNTQGGVALALPAINSLIQADIPLIFNSSKPACDILTLQQKLNIHSPFICENGAALYLPLGSGGAEFSCQEFGIQKNKILHVLAGISEQQKFSYLAFSTIPDSQLPKLTKLDLPVLERLTSREYTESILWRDSDIALEKFTESLLKSNLICRRVGDIVQVYKQVNKALPVPALKKWYEQTGKSSLHMLALGGGPHDMPVLELADEAYFFGEPFEAIKNRQQNDHIVSVPNKGPSCWSQLVLNWLEQHSSTANE